jgi:hypothetical protein
MSSRLISLVVCGTILAVSSLTTVKPVSAGSTDTSIACPGFNPSQFVHAVTKSSDIYICGADTPHEYVGISKKNGAKIILNLRKSPDKFTYIAVNGTYRYVLTRKYLKITNKGRVIVNEKAKWLGWD